MTVVNGWTLLEHPLFRQQVAELTNKVAKLRSTDPGGYKKKKATKRLAAISRLVYEEIPQNPGHDRFRMGSTLEPYTGWFRAKFYQQYRLFFRYDSSSRIILYAWVNDEDTLRAYEGDDDAYRVFAKMLESGNPPDDWDTLRKASKPARLHDDDAG